MAPSQPLPFPLLTLLAVALAVSGCATAFQDARMVGPGIVDVTLSLAPVAGSGGGETEDVGNMFGAHVMVGVSERVNVGVGYARFQVANEDEGVNLVGFGPKLSVQRNRVALVLPVGFAFGGAVETADSLIFSPTAIFTGPISDRVDFNLSVKAVIPFMLVGFNVGVGVRATDRVMLRPETSFLFSPGESGTVWSAGVGVSFRSR